MTVFIDRDFRGNRQAGSYGGVNSTKQPGRSVHLRRENLDAQDIPKGACAQRSIKKRERDLSKEIKHGSTLT